MNKFYKVVFCKTTGVMKAVSETAKSGKKTKSISIAAGVLSAGVVFSTAALAATGDPVVAGDAAGLNALAVGETNTVDGNRSTAIGSENSVGGESNTALGVNNNIRPTEDYFYNGDSMETLLTPSIRSTAIGVENTIEGNESVTTGVFNKAKANNVTITGGRNQVSSKESGTYGQGNYIGEARLVPTLMRVDDGYRIGYVGDIDAGSYAYGNSNQVIGDKSHAVGNSNNVSGNKNGLLGSGNNLSTERYEQPRRMATARMAVGDGELSPVIVPVGDGELPRTRWDGRDEGSFLVGNENDVNGINTHAVGNQNQIRNDDNVTLGSGNRVEFHQDEYMGEATRIRDDSERRIIRRNTSTAIVGANNTLEAEGVHIVGTENNIQQAYSYVVGGGNTVELPFMSPMIMAGDLGMGSNVFGSRNYTESEKSLVVGDGNRIDQKSLLAVVTGSENNISGVSSSTVGNNNQIRKDVGGAHGTMNKVQGNTGALQAINAAYDAYNSGEAESFEGLDLDDDGVVDFATVEEFMLMVNQSGSYAYGNINNIQGEGIHTVGNNNEFSGNNNKGVGNNNRIGQVGGMVGNSDAVLPTVKFYDSAAYGDLNIVNANSAQAIGNKNSLEKDFSSITGYNNTVTQGLDGELVDVTIEQQRLAGTFVSGNDNLIESHGGHVSGSGNEFQADRATLSGSENTVIGNEGHVVGNDNNVYGSSNNGFGNNNVIGKVMNGDYSSVDSSHVVGNNNTMEGNLSSAFGNENTVSGDESSVVGLGNTTEGEGSLILGNYNENKSSMTTMVGGYNNIDDDYSDNVVAVGQNNRMSGNQAAAFGNNNSIEKDASGAIGVENYIAGGFNSDGLAGEGLNGMGDAIDYNKYIERGSYAQGNKNNVRGDTTHVYGYQNGVLGNKASVMGANNSVSGNGTQVIGNDNTIGYNNDGMPQYGDNIAVLGSKNTVEAENSFVVGSNNTVDRGADGSLIFGSNASSSVQNGVAIGNSSTVDRENTVSFGSAGEERQLTNVADATETKDAVNLGQLNASLRDTTGGKNLTATRTDTGYEVALNDAITLDSVTTGSSTLDTNGLKVGDVTVSSVGLDNAGNRVTSVGDATLRSDAVNYGQFQDGLAGTIKSVTGDENITATTDENKNVTVALNKNLVADSLTTGSTIVNTDGVRAGDVFLSSTTGLDNAGNRVTNVGDAVENTDAVNYGQFKAGLTDTTAGKNVSVKRTDTGYEVSTVEDMTLTSVKTGDTLINNAGFTNGATTLGGNGLKVGDVVVSNVGLDNAGNRVTSVGDATLRSDAVNYGQFQDGLAGTIKSVTGDENITATTDEDKNVTLNLKKDIAVDSVTAGNTVINNSGFTNGATTLGNTGLKVGEVTVGASGLDNAGNRVTNVGDAVEQTDAINLKQLNASLRDTTGDENITATKTDTGYNVALNKAVALESVTTGNTSVNTDGVRAGAVFLSSTSGLDNAGNRVTSVGDATLRSDAVNYGQFQDGLAGTIKSVTGDENITATTDEDKNVIVELNKDLNVDSIVAGSNTLDGNGLMVGDVSISNETGIYAGNKTVSGVANAVNDDDAVNLGQVSDIDDRLTAENINQTTNIANNTNAINKGFYVGNGQTSNKFELGDTVNLTADSNTKVTTTETGVQFGLADDISVNSTTAGSNVFNTGGLTVGDVSISNEVGVYAGNKTVSGVANASENDEAVNLGQFNEALAGTIKSVTGDENITATTDDKRNVTVELNKDVNLDSVTAGSNVFNGNGLNVGGVSISNETGVYAGGMKVGGVGNAVNADDAVNLGQMNEVDDRLTTQINKGFNVGNGVTSNKFELGDTVDITADKNTKVTTTATGVQVGLADDIFINSMTSGNAIFNNSGFRVGDVVLSGSTGLHNAGFTVSGVGNAVNRDDAVNKGQLDDAISGIVLEGVNVTGGSNITVNQDGNKVQVGLNNNIAVDSVTTGQSSLNNDGLTVGDVVLSGSTGLNNAGNTVSGVGNAVNTDDAVNLGQMNEVDDRLTAENKAQDVTISNKVDTSVFEADQARQDALIATKADKEYVDAENNEQNIVIAGKADTSYVDAADQNLQTQVDQKVDKDAFEASQKEQNKALKDETDRLDAKDKDLQNQVDQKVEKEEFLADQKRQDDALKEESDIRDSKDKDLQAQVDKKVEKEEFLADQKRQDDALKEKADQSYVDTQNSAQSQAYEQKLEQVASVSNEKLEQMVIKQSMIDNGQNDRINQNSQMISDLGYKVDGLEDKLSAGIASSIAFASMPTAINKGEVRIAGGTGYFNGASALAVGITGATETGDFTYKFGGSYTEDGGAVVGGGVSYRVW